jgi:hypothetical protein
MAKYLTLFVFGALVFDPAARGQFGGGANIAASIGSAAGRRIGDQMNSSLRQGTRSFGTGKAKGKGAAGGPAGAGGARADTTNVPPPPPPPPPLRRAVATSKKSTAPSWMTEPFIGPPAPPPPPVNVDLALIERGMARDSVLALGKPSSKITLYEDGHMVEIYQYRNQTLASGTVRLRDGAVSAIEARP